MREKGQIKETLMASMSIMQLECGSSILFFNLSATAWNPLVTQTWITHFWPNGINIKFHPNDFWVPKPVRQRHLYYGCCINDVPWQPIPPNKYVQNITADYLFVRHLIGWRQEDTIGIFSWGRSWSFGVAIKIKLATSWKPPDDLVETMARIPHLMVWNSSSDSESNG